MSRYRPYDPTNIQSFINDHAQHNTAASVANWGSIFEEYLKSVDVTITSLTDQELLNHVTNFYFQLVTEYAKILHEVEVMKSNPLHHFRLTKKNKSTDTILKIIDRIWWLLLVFILPSLEL